MGRSLFSRKKEGAARFLQRAVAVRAERREEFSLGERQRNACARPCVREVVGGVCAFARACVRAREREREKASARGEGTGYERVSWWGRARRCVPTRELRVPAHGEGGL